jgi:hypothetical protein
VAGPIDRRGGGGIGGEGVPRLTPGLLVVLCVLMTLNPIVANMYLPRYPVDIECVSHGECLL